MTPQAAQSKWRPYPEYKDSCVEWQGEIPAGWDSFPIKRLEKHAAYLAQTGPFGAQLHASDYVDEGVPLILVKQRTPLQAAGHVRAGHQLLEF